MGRVIPPQLRSPRRVRTFHTDINVSLAGRSQMGFPQGTNDAVRQMPMAIDALGKETYASPAYLS